MTSYVIALSGPIEGKTGKTSVLPGFSKIECGGNMYAAAACPTVMVVLPSPVARAAPV